MRRLALSVQGLVKQYTDGTKANIGIDLVVRDGEIVSILGPNGAGKTTFLRQVTTELRPTAGVIRVLGIDAVREPSRAKAMMGITPQESGLFESLTVREHLELFARFKGLSSGAAAAGARGTIDDLGLSEQAGRRVGDLSGGQRRRVLIGLALLGHPPLLVLDEPTTGLDPISRRSVWNVLRRAAAGGRSILLSTHYMEEAERLSDRVAIVSGGRLVAVGTVDELLGRLTNSYRLRYRDPLDGTSRERVHRCATAEAADEEVRRLGVSEYSVARASLEDVYFELAGETFDDAVEAVS